MISYRMSSIGEALPQTHSYSGPSCGYNIWTGEPDPWEVYAGAQVWCVAWNIAECALGFEMDGTYGPEEGYAHILIIESDYIHPTQPWDCVKPDDVQALYSVSTQTFVAHIEHLLREAGVALDEPEDCSAYLEEHEEMLASWLHQHMKPVPVVWVDTLTKAAGTAEIRVLP